MHTVLHSAPPAHPALATQARPPAPAERPALGALLGNADTSVLLAAWPDRPHAAHGDPARLAAPLRALAQAGPRTLFDNYRGAFAFGRGARSAHPAAGEGHPGRYFDMGLTVHLHEIGPQLPGSAEWLQELESELGATPGSARLAVFASPAGDGLPWHFDGEDVISIQLVGEKVFDVAPVEGLRFPVGDQFGPGMAADERLYAQCPNGFPEPPEQPSQSHRMRPGSVLFLPRGHWHRTSALTDSLAVSVVLRPPTAAQRLLQLLEQRLLADADWRAPLYGSAAQQQKHWDALLTRLPALIDGLHGAAVLAPDTRDPEQVADAQRWQRVPGASMAIEATQTTPQLTITALDAQGQPRVTLQRPVGTALAPLLRWLATQRPAFSTRDAAAHDPRVPPPDLRRLLLGLADAGALRTVGP